MSLRNSLRFRILGAFVLFGLFIGITFGIAAALIPLGFEDELFERRLEIEMTSFLHRYSDDPDTPLPDSAYITGYIGTTKMPAEKQQVARRVSAGIHEDQGKEYHLAKGKLPGSDEFLYLFYDTGDLELHHQWMTRIIAQLILMLTVIILIAVSLGWLLSRQIIAPLSRLAELVRHSEPKNLPTGFSNNFYPDEVGALARTLESALQRVSDFVTREQRFTRDASHELRTPVTVIKGALEIMQQHEACQRPPLASPLGRITRNIREMEHLIETFLWLGRETPGETPQPLAVKALVVETIAQHRHLLEKKAVTVAVEEVRATTVCVPPAIVKIMVGNLIRNAFHFTAGGAVRVVLGGDHLAIADTGPGLAAPEEGLNKHPNPSQKFESIENIGFGIGLTIVERLCERYGWSLELKSPPGQGTTAILRFESPVLTTSPKKA